MDVQGAKVVRPWAERAKADYVTLVDRDNTLGARYGFDFIPLAMLFDESGRMVQAPRYVDIAKAKFRDRIAGWLNGGPPPPAPPKREPSNPAGLSSPEAELRFALAALLLGRDNGPEAVKQLRKALALEPENWLIRKQIWAIEHPDRFYDGPVDFAWQNQQLKKERDER
jgi:hypothetical protein